MKYKIPLTQDEISGKGLAITVGGGAVIGRWGLPFAARLLGNVAGALVKAKVQAAIAEDDAAADAEATPIRKRASRTATAGAAVE